MAADNSKQSIANSSTSSHMQSILNEFKSIYQNRLKKLDGKQYQDDETLKLKNKTLESYVKDLVEQNDVLVQTIDELEKEANNRVSLLETKLQKASLANKVREKNN
jgi:hypothetical protein